MAFVDCISNLCGPELEAAKSGCLQEIVASSMEVAVKLKKTCLTDSTSQSKLSGQDNHGDRP